MATQSLNRRYRPRRFAELNGQEFVFLVPALVITVLLLAGTELTLSHLFWTMSLFLQIMFGISLVSFLTPLVQLSDSVKFLAGCLAGFVSYSWVYQLVLYIISDVQLTWLTVNFLAFATFLLLQHRLLLNRSSSDSNLRKLITSDIEAPITLMIGGGLLIVGLSEMRSLLWIGVGVLLAKTINTQSLATVGARRGIQYVIFSMAFVVSAIMAFKIDRPLGRFWFVLSNDLQTSISLAVSISRFGLWDQGRYSGFRDTYHWGVYGWAGMTAPFGDYVVQVAILAPIVVCGLLFCSGVLYIERITHNFRSNINSRQVLLSATAASVFIASSLSSFATQFGMLNVIGFCLLIESISPREINGRNLLMLSLSAFSAVWANALGIAFLTGALVLNLAIRLFVSNIKHDGYAKRNIGLNFVLVLVAAIAWSLLYLPAARGGSFKFDPLGQRDKLFPATAEVLDFLTPQVRALLFELLSSQALFFALLTVGTCLVLSPKIELSPLQGPVAFGISSLLAIFMLSGYEIQKFTQWGSFATFVLLGVPFAFSLHSISSSNRGKRAGLVVAVAAVGLLTFASGLASLVFSYLGKYSPSVELLKAMPIAVVACGLVFDSISRRGTALVLSVSTWIGVSMFAFQFGQYSGQYVAESRQRYELSHADETGPYSLLMSDSDVEAVAEFIRSNTAEKSLIASNYFCNDGATCQSQKLLEVKQSNLTPNIWGLESDMSNLAAFTQRRFLIQAPRHVFGNFFMPSEAQRRWQLSADYAVTQRSRRELQEYGVDYFVLDWDALDSRSRVEIPGTIFGNSRFSVISFNYELSIDEGSRSPEG